MNETEGIKQNAKESIRQDWLAVGNSLLMAMQEIALELGGEELAERVTQSATSNGVLPSPDALKVLEDFRPGSAQLAMARMTELEEADRERRLEEIRKPRLAEYGKAVLKGFASFNVFGSPSRRS